MGPVATVITRGCLDAMRWLLWLTAALLVALLLVQYLRGDADAMPARLFVMAAVAAFAGWISGFVSSRVPAARS